MWSRYLIKHTPRSRLNSSFYFHPGVGLYVHETESRLPFNGRKLLESDNGLPRFLVTSPSHHHGKRGGKWYGDVGAGRLGGQHGVDHFLRSHSCSLGWSWKSPASGSVFALTSCDSADTTARTRTSNVPRAPLTRPGDVSQGRRLYPLTALLRGKGSSYSKFPAEDERVAMVLNLGVKLRMCTSLRWGSKVSMLGFFLHHLCQVLESNLHRCVPPRLSEPRPR